MEYDKQNKKRFVIDYHNNEINNYLFDTNKFSLENKTEIIKDKNKQFCSKYALEKDYDGFIYSGNKNKCFLFNTNQFNKKIDQEMLDKYTIKRYKKTKYDNDFNDYESQNNSIHYFNNENHYNFNFKNKIKEFDTSNVKKCLDECKNNSTCKNALYMEQSKKCHFFKNKKFKNKNNIDYEKKYDTYTIKKTINKNNIYHKNFIEDINHNNENNIDFNNIKYSSCINAPQYKDEKEMNNLFDKICKKEYGDEYSFIQKEDDKNIIQCNKDQIKIRCNYKLDNIIENFKNNELETDTTIGTDIKTTNINTIISSNTSIESEINKSKYYIYITLFLFIIFSVILFINFI